VDELLGHLAQLHVALVADLTQALDGGLVGEPVVCSTEAQSTPFGRFDEE
jgi:hypothetical protein